MEIIANYELSRVFGFRILGFRAYGTSQGGRGDFTEFGSFRG